MFGEFSIHGKISRGKAAGNILDKFEQRNIQLKSLAPYTIGFVAVSEDIAIEVCPGQDR